MNNGLKHYRITLSKEHGGYYIRQDVWAIDEKEAFLKVREMAEQKGIILPDEIWTETEELKH